MKFYRPEIVSQPPYADINARYRADESDVEDLLLKGAALPAAGRGPEKAPGIPVKLSALHPRHQRHGLRLDLRHSQRIDTTVNHVLERIRAGNAYVNRNMIGAVVGVQPFGGEGLSGTGPRRPALSLFHYATEHTISINTTAAGGNASLMSLQEEDV